MSEVILLKLSGNIVKKEGNIKKNLRVKITFEAILLHMEIYVRDSVNDVVYCGQVVWLNWNII